jgi:hypothetical protein
MHDTDASEVEAYVEELIEKGAYRVDGFDPANGERLLVVVPEVMKEVDPEMYEYLQLDSEIEVGAAFSNLEEMGLITRIDDDNFEVTELGALAIKEAFAEEEV